MAYPNRQQIEIALLQVLVDLGGEARPRDTYSRVAKFFPQLTPEELKARSPRSKYVVVWWNKVQWAKDDLKNEGCIEGTPTKVEGTWKITEKGRQRLRDSGGQIAAAGSDEATKYLEKFKQEASEWFAKADFVRKYFIFFQSFFKRENLEKAEWPDIQKIGAHMHCFQSMALARGNALGRPNHPIEHYRKSFTFLAHGPGTPAERIHKFCDDPEYRLDYFGKSAVSELVGYLFPDQFMFVNTRDQFAAEFLNISGEKVGNGDVAAELEAFNKATRPLAKQYDTIVGRQTDLPLNLEVDQFFSWLYKQYGGTDEMPEVESPASTPHYWALSVGRDGEHWEEFYQNGIIAIGWEGTADLRQFKNKEELRARLLELFPSDSDKKNDVHACWQFVREIQKGDIIFAKQGQTRLLGYGVVEGDYEYDETRKYYKHVRRVKWLAKGKWELPEQHRMALKTLTDVTQFAEFVTLVTNKVGLQLPAEAEPRESASAAIRESFDDSSSTTQVEIEEYDRTKAMNGLFLAASQFDEMLEALVEKKNLVLQGAPGVGKTFVAKRLAYALIGSNDHRRVETIQFHQSYSYEDFIQGFRPTPNGHFDLKFGIFYEFCRRAQRDESAKKPYVFIIDEINRGNLSKIFGELMMLIEPDKRGREHAIPLAYSQSAAEKFYIPENLHLIGMMNTADRSLAMVDYALRRRFRFITLKPEFASTSFRKSLVDAGAAPELVSEIVARMNALNEVIAADTKNLGFGYQIGHSFFCARNGIKPDERWYRRVIESEIVPLIQEYWFDNEQKVKEQRLALLA